ncbi:MAG: hypothetical protein U9R57_10140 [Thermodesulfobacteriota bacterium]|nr:hypothetical protein [Thermodesulfobacteriota bacterium]
MIQTTAILACLFFFSSCQPYSAGNYQDINHSQVTVKSCPVSADAVLSCIASSNQLSAQAINSEFNLIVDSLEPGADSNRLLCLSLHRHSSSEQQEKGKAILEDFLTRAQCSKQQDLAGLLLIMQGNIDLHKKYFDKNWKLHLEKKEISNKKDTIKQEFDHEIISYQRRIQDLEQQVQKLKELESVLNKTVQP